MKKLLLASVVALLPAAALGADSALQYAYPVAPQGLPAPDPTKTFQAKGTTTGMKLTMAQINNQFGPPDWFPDEHPTMPAMVKNGRAPHVRACDNDFRKRCCIRRTRKTRKLCSRVPN